MFCRNCGKEIDPNASYCISCGFAKGTGNKYCANCGCEVAEGQAVCVKCGYSLQSKPNTEGKSKLVAGLLGIFLGGLGVHNFYLGNNSRAVAQILLSCVGIGAIWGFIEGILILCGKINTDADGNPLKDDL